MAFVMNTKRVLVTSMKAIAAYMAGCKTPPPSRLTRESNVRRENIKQRCINHVPRRRQAEIITKGEYKVL